MVMERVTVKVEYTVSEPVLGQGSWQNLDSMSDFGQGQGTDHDQIQALCQGEGNEQAKGEGQGQCHGKNELQGHKSGSKCVSVSK